jgi:predicted XRE-type DNA-binding protein
LALRPHCRPLFFTETNILAQIVCRLGTRCAAVHCQAEDETLAASSQWPNVLTDYNYFGCYYTGGEPVQSKAELAVSIKDAMEAKRISREQLATMLGINHFMIEKLLRGDIVPSTHLEKQLVQALGILVEKRTA